MTSKSEMKRINVLKGRDMWDGIGKDKPQMTDERLEEMSRKIYGDYLYDPQNAVKIFAEALRTVRDETRLKQIKLTDVSDDDLRTEAAKAFNCMHPAMDIKALYTMGYRAALKKMRGEE